MGTEHSRQPNSQYPTIDTMPRIIRPPFSRVSCWVGFSPKVGQAESQSVRLMFLTDPGAGHCPCLIGRSRRQAPSWADLQSLLHLTHYWKGS